MEAFLIGHLGSVPSPSPAAGVDRSRPPRSSGRRTGAHCVQASAWLHARTAVDVEFADQLADIEPEIDAARLDVVHDRTEAVRMGVFVDCNGCPPATRRRKSEMANGMGMSRTGVAVIVVTPGH